MALSRPLRTTLVAVLAAAALSGLPGCGRRETEKEGPGAEEVVAPNGEGREGWECIALAGNLDEIAAMHIRALLKSHGIDCLMENDIKLFISVYKKDAHRATALLLNDAKRLRYGIRFTDGEVIEPLERDWREDRLDKPYADVLRLATYPADSEIGRLLRADKVREQTTQYPIVHSIRILRRDFLRLPEEAEELAPSSSIHPLQAVGYDVDVELHARPADNDCGNRLYFQVFDGGKTVNSLGGNAWRGSRLGSR